MLALSAIYAAKKQGETLELSQYFSQESYLKAFIAIDTITDSTIPNLVKSVLLAMLDDYYTQIIKAREASPQVGNTVANALAQSMRDVMKYLEKSLEEVNEPYIKAVSLWREVPEPVYDWWDMRQEMKDELNKIAWKVGNIGIWVSFAEEADKIKEAKHARKMKTFVFECELGQEPDLSKSSCAIGRNPSQ